MKKNIRILFVAFVLSLVPTTYVCAQWNYQGDYCDGLALVQDDDNMFGYIDNTGQVVIPCTWKDTLPFIEGLAVVEDANGNRHKIDKTGKIIE